MPVPLPRVRPLISFVFIDTQLYEIHYPGLYPFPLFPNAVSQTATSQPAGYVANAGATSSRNNPGAGLPPEERLFGVELIWCYRLSDVYHYCIFSQDEESLEAPAPQDPA